MKRGDLPDLLKNPTVRKTIDQALDEDIGAGDVTSNSLVPKHCMASAELLAREACVVSGGRVAEYVFRKVDPKLKTTICIPDGGRASAGQAILTVKGPVRGMLTAERVALNFMQRMCGIATLTGTFIEKARPHRVQILDTRKTTPLLRVFEKYAVLCGGGTNHRFNLNDRALVKDNHRAVLSTSDALSLRGAIECIRLRHPDLEVEVEVENEVELLDALAGKPEWILLDNMTPAQLRRCVLLTKGRAKLEASGGITLKNVARYAATGVTALSVGALTHSVRSIDLSLEIKS